MGTAQQVCEMFDLTVLNGIEEPSTHVAPCPQVAADGDGCTCAPVQVFAIGANSELSAGLRGFAMSPYFNTMEELEAWCVRNSAKLKEFADKEELPDATNWA
jgi:hypothetical protein